MCPDTLFKGGEFFNLEDLQYYPLESLTGSAHLSEKKEYESRMVLRIRRTARGHSHSLSFIYKCRTDLFTQPLTDWKWLDVPNHK